MLWEPFLPPPLFIGFACVALLGSNDGSTMKKKENLIFALFEQARKSKFVH